MLRGGAGAASRRALDHLAASAATAAPAVWVGGARRPRAPLPRHPRRLHRDDARRHHASTAAGANPECPHVPHLLVNVRMACKTSCSRTRPSPARGDGGPRPPLLDALDTAAVAPPAAASAASPRRPAPCVALAALSVGPPGGTARLRALDLRVFPGDRLASPAPTAPARHRSFACSPACGRTAAPRAARRAHPLPPAAAVPPPRHAEAAAFVPRRRAAGGEAAPAEWAPRGRRRLRARRRLPPRCAPLPPHPAPAPAARAGRTRRVASSVSPRVARAFAVGLARLCADSRAPRAAVGGPLAGRDAARLDRLLARAHSSPSSTSRRRRSSPPSRRRSSPSSPRRASRCCGGAPRARGVPLTSSASTATAALRSRLSLAEEGSRRRRRLACDDVVVNRGARPYLLYSAATAVPRGSAASGASGD